MARRMFFTMRDLQKISAKMIEEMPHALPIKSGNLIVGIITPLRKANLAELAEVEAIADTLAAMRSDAEEARLEAAFQLVEDGKAGTLVDGLTQVEAQQTELRRLSNALKRLKSELKTDPAVPSLPIPAPLKKRRAR